MNQTSRRRHRRAAHIPNSNAVTRRHVRRGGATIVDEYVLCSDARGLVYVPENQAVNNVKRNILSSFKKYEIYLHFRTLDWMFFLKRIFSFKSEFKSGVDFSVKFL